MVRVDLAARAAEPGAAVDDGQPRDAARRARRPLARRAPTSSPTEVAFGLRLSQTFYNLNTAAAAEALRIQANEAMAAAFEQVDFVIAATNPGPAFAADAVTSARAVGHRRLGAVDAAGRAAPSAARCSAPARWPACSRSSRRRSSRPASERFPDLVNMGALTIPANLYGNPAVSIPAGTMDGLPVGMQVLARHHADALLFDLALAAERHRPVAARRADGHRRRWPPSERPPARAARQPPRGTRCAAIGRQVVVLDVVAADPAGCAPRSARS